MESLVLCLVLLQDPASGAPSGGAALPAPRPAPVGMGWTDFVLLFGGMLFIFYFVAFRPQARERKQREAMLGNLKKGDRVVTNSGLLGTVASVTPTEVVLKVDDNVRLRFTRQAIQSVLGETEESSDREKKPSGHA